MVIVFVVNAHNTDEETHIVGVFSNRDSAIKVAERIRKQNARYQERLKKWVDFEKEGPKAPSVLCSTVSVAAYKLRD